MMRDYAQDEGSTDGRWGNGAHVRRWLELARVSLIGRSSLLLAFVAAAVIVVIDDVFFGYPFPLRVTAPLDELAHAATMVVVLCALAGRAPRAFGVGSLLGAVILDVDHLTIVLHVHVWAPPHGRPYSHSLATVTAVTLLTLLNRRWRAVGIGVACGLLSHLFRDLATGVVPLFWPLTTAQFSIPHSLYEAAIIGVLGWTVVYRKGGGLGLDSGNAKTVPFGDGG